MGHSVAYAWYLFCAVFAHQTSGYREDASRDVPLDFVSRFGKESAFSSSAMPAASSSIHGSADVFHSAASSTPDAAAAVRNLLESLRGQPGLGGGQGRRDVDIPYPHLAHLLPTSITVPMIDAAPEQDVDGLLNYLPPAVIVLASSPDTPENKNEPTTEAVEAAKASLSLEDKRSLLKKVLRSPQLHQALGSLTMALRDGGLPGIADALGVQVENGGYLQAGGMPMGGGEAVKAFVEGVKKKVQEKRP